jgi:hypothetical protein
MHQKPQLVRLGQREIETLGLNQGFWTDLYHRAMTAYFRLSGGIVCCAQRRVCVRIFSRA